MNSKVSSYAIITDDPTFAATISHYLFKANEYIPILTLPRMDRDDWENEVLKRTTVINRFDINMIFCKGKDYGLLAPFRKYAKAKVIPLKRASDIVRYISCKAKKHKWLKINKKQPVRSLIKALSYKVNPFNTEKTTHKYKTNYFNIFNSKYLLVLELSGASSDIAAINYAIANKFDIWIVKKLGKRFENDIINTSIKLANEEYIKSIEKINQALNLLREKIFSIVDFHFIEKKYSAIQFITNKIYPGFVIDKVPTVHLAHLQSELNLLNEYYYLNKFKNDEIPSFLFVDTQEPDLTSEVPEISNNLKQFRCFKFYLNGKHANLQNFKIYSHFFPYDVLFITGHGSSPSTRIATYSFVSSDDKEHTAKVIEYYRFDGVKGDLIGVTRRWYPIEFDNVKWKNKKALKKAGISHIMREFASASKNLKLIKEEPHTSDKIEGIQLSDNVFMGEISSFEDDNNPIVVLNSCGSLVEAGELINFGLTRVLIGTLWPVLDIEAKSFAVSLFNEMTNDTVSNSFFYSRAQVKDNYTRYSYVMLGTLFQYLSHRKEIQNLSKTKKIMGDRMLRSLQRATGLFYEGYIESIDLRILLNFGDAFDKFLENNHLGETELRKGKGIFRRIFSSLNQ